MFPEHILSLLEIGTNSRVSVQTQNQLLAPEVDLETLLDWSLKFEFICLFIQIYAHEAHYLNSDLQAQL